MDNRKLVAILEEVGLKGSGPPSGTPPRAGLIYTDTTDGTRYLSRNVLNFSGSAYVMIPSVTNARSVKFRFKTSNLTPSATAPFTDGTAPNLYTALASGNARIIGSANTQLNFNGVNITSNTTTPSSGLWNSLISTATDSVDRQVSRVGVNAALTFKIDALVADVQIFGAGDVLLRSYSINEGSGTTINDSVSGQNGTLTIGSGSWQLDWVPLN
jgi:hypothetical protein